MNNWWSALKLVAATVAATSTTTATQSGTWHTYKHTQPLPDAHHRHQHGPHCGLREPTR